MNEIIALLVFLSLYVGIFVMAFFMVFISLVTDNRRIKFYQLYLERTNQTGKYAIWQQNEIRRRKNDKM